VRAFSFATATIVSLFACPLGASDLPLKSEIWRDLSIGDSPEVVAGKISAIDGVKRVKIKAAKNDGNARVDVSYVDGGIEILGEKYRILPIFAGVSLKQVALSTGETCVPGIFDRFSRLRAVLIEKYPNETTQTGSALTLRDLQDAEHSATGTIPTSIGAFYGNDRVVAFVRLKFTRLDPPPGAYGGSALMNSLSALAWNQFRQAEATCNGTGDRKVEIQILYMTKADFDGASSKVIEQDKKERNDAATKL